MSSLPNVMTQLNVPCTGYVLDTHHTGESFLRNALSDHNGLEL